MRKKLTLNQAERRARLRGRLIWFTLLPFKSNDVLMNWVRAVRSVTA